MDKHHQELTRGEKESRYKSVIMNSNLSVLHQNMQSISNKQIEIDLVLKSSLKKIDVLCLTEHYLKLIQIDQYKLVSYLSRKNYNHGGSCVYVKKASLLSSKLFQGISVEKDFEMSITELVDYGYIIVCIYRSPDSNLRIFLKKS
jgi:hypothetical protein